MAERTSRVLSVLCAGVLAAVACAEAQREPSARAAPPADEDDAKARADLPFMSCVATMREECGTCSIVCPMGSAARCQPGEMTQWGERKCLRKPQCTCDGVSLEGKGKEPSAQGGDDAYASCRAPTWPKPLSERSRKQCEPCSISCAVGKAALCVPGVLRQHVSVSSGANPDGGGYWTSEDPPKCVANADCRCVKPGMEAHE